MPASVSEVEVYVTPYAVGPKVAEVIPRMTSLRFVQTLTAGVDNIRPAIPPGVTLCSGRGIHDTSTAELVLTLVLSSLRGVPEFVRAQDRHEWTPGWHPALADKTVLLVGYGAIGAAVEARLAPFECSVVRVARSARDGVHAITELPALLPDADVVVLVLPLTDETRGLVDASFLASMKDGALLVNVARGPVVDTAALVAELTSGRLRQRWTWSIRSRCLPTTRSGAAPDCWSPRTSAARAARCGPARTAWSATSCTASRSARSL